MVIGVTGRKGSGKDTICKYLAANYGFQHLSFAEPLKIAAGILLNTDVESLERWKNEDKSVVVMGTKPETILKNDKEFKSFVCVNYPISVRHFLQRLGTEVGRGLFGPDFWIHQLARKVNVHSAADYCISDVRFLNEANAIEHWNGQLWRVIRPSDEEDGHASEQEQEEIEVHYELNNNAEIHVLYEAVDEIMEDRYGRQRVSG